MLLLSTLVSSHPLVMNLLVRPTSLKSVVLKPIAMFLWTEILRRSAVYEWEDLIACY